MRKSSERGSHHRLRVTDAKAMETPTAYFVLPNSADEMGFAKKMSAMATRLAQKSVIHVVLSTLLLCAFVGLWLS